jgi:hypothetical protein
MKRMPSLLDIAGLLFGGFGLAMGAFFVVGGIIGFFDGISWIAIAIGPLFLWFGGSTIRQQFSWLTHYPGKYVELMGDRIVVRGRSISYNQIVSVAWRYTVTKKTMNFMAAGIDYTVEGWLGLANGETIAIADGQGPSTWMGSSLGQDSSQTLLDKFSAIDEKTLPARLNIMIAALSEKNCLIFDKKVITKDGCVMCKEHALPLKQFYLYPDDPFTLRFRFKSTLWEWLKGLVVSNERCVVSLVADRTPFMIVAERVFGLRWDVPKARSTRPH